MASQEIRFRSEVESEVEAFELGCVVDKTFFAHFRSRDHSDIGRAKTVFINYKKKIVIQIKTFEEITSEDSRCLWNEDKYELNLNLSQIRSISLNENQMIIKSVYPPLLYRIVDIADQSLDRCSDQPFDQSMTHSADKSIVQSVTESAKHSADQTIDQSNDIKSCDPSEEIDTSFEFDSGIEDKSVISKDFAEEEALDWPIYREDNEPKDHFIGLRLRTSKLMTLNEELFTKTNCIKIVFKDIKYLEDIVFSIESIEPLIAFNDQSFETIEAKVCELSPSPVNGLPFAIEYFLQALTNISFQFIDALNLFNHSYKDFVNLIKQLSQIDENAVENGLNELRHNIENNLDIKPMEDLRQSFDKYKNQPKKWTNKFIVLVRRCILTPTRILLLPALPLQESRFLRTADPEFVIRILIKDEDMQSLSFTVGKTSLPKSHEILGEVNNFLNEMIVERLRSGICIAGRTYEVVGASTSQLRDHGLVLYAPDQQNRTAQDIKALMGDLQSLRNAAKFIARIGQSMSQSMGFIKIDPKNVELIDDIVGGIHPRTGQSYVFSDGVGKISPKMAEQLVSALHIKPVSTFQIRLAGYKGILVIDPKLDGHKIQMRPSMKKFDCDWTLQNSTELDVLKVSEPRTCYLNRPLILILNELGVKNEVFLELLYVRQKQLITAFDCDCKAIDTMKAYSAVDFGFDGLLKSRIEVLNEPFFVDIIQSIIKKVSLDLKNKARIQIPYDFARVMYGVLDETNTLDYGQVFVQYSHSDGQKRVLTGEILVTKYPCMHPGDVRKLTAIDVPALRHIVDCIVFPARGQRPHPDEMAGSDLDGDEYSVIWFEGLIFKGDNWSPMWFPNGEAIDLGRNVTTEDILRFYCRFIVNNQVGLLASSHLAWADLNSLFSQKCYHLAHRYAVALDYAKTGINEYLRNEDKPKRYPEFMMKDNEKPTYKSSKALGKLFHKNCYFMQLMDDFWSENFDYKVNKKLIDPNAQKYMSEARDMFAIYKTSVKDLMDRFGIEKESELMSVTFNKSNKYLSAKKDSNDTYELVTNVVKHFIKDFVEQFEFGVEDNERTAKASAWYQISHELNREQTETFYGFGWIGFKYLNELALKNEPTEHVCPSDMKITSISKNLVPKQFIISAFKEIISKYLENNTDIMIEFSNFKNSLERKAVSVIDECMSSDKELLPLSTVSLLFNRLSQISDFNNDYEVAITSLMASLKCRRLGFNRGLILLMQKQNPIPVKSEENRNYVLSTAITEEVAELFAGHEEVIDSDRERKLIEALKKEMDVKQIEMKYGFKGHESFICAVGHRNAIRKLKSFLNDKNVFGKIKYLLERED